MGEIASYFIIIKGKKTEKCRCHLCERTFDTKGAIFVHFKRSKKHWHLRKLMKMKSLPKYFPERNLEMYFNERKERKKSK